MATVAEVATQVMEHLVSHDGDSGHGYTWGARWGGSGQESIVVDGKRYYFRDGDRDCSSGIISAYKAAGLDVNATFTGDMLPGFLATGLFEWKPMSFVAQRGDIYLNKANHTALCTSPNPDMLAEFCINEFGGVYGGKQGDQTGAESRKAPFYNYMPGGWDGILHFKGNAQASPSVPKQDADKQKPEKVTWRVKQGGKWYEAGFNGNKDVPITAIAIDFNGHGWYQVCTEDYGWLDVVRGFNIKDEDEGYAGWKDSPIIAVRAYYETPDPTKTGWLSAKYRASDVGMAGFYDWQFDDDVWNGQDGFAGDFKRIDQFELKVA